MAPPKKRLNEMEKRFEEVERALSDPLVASRGDDLKRFGKEHSELRPTVEAWRVYKQAESDLSEARGMLSGSQGEERAVPRERDRRSATHAPDPRGSAE